MSLALRTRLCAEYLSLCPDGRERAGAASLFAGVQATALQAQGVPEADTPGRAICALFEELQPGHAKRSRGVFYTPADLVRRTTDWTIGAAPVPGGRALDPACGGGAFLLEIAARLGPGNVHGVDIDPLAVAVARASLTLDFGDLPGISEQIVVGDALDEATAIDGGPFDYVLGNPPYAPLLGARGRQFAHLFSKARPNAFGAFLTRSGDWVRPGGRIGLVLPRSLARVAAYEPLREVLAGLGALERVADVGVATAGVGYEQLVVVIRQGAPPGTTEVWRCLPGRPETLRMSAPQRELLRGGPLPIGLDGPGLALLRRLQGAGPALGEVADIFRGLGLSVRDPLVSDQGRPGWSPALRGVDVGRDGVRGHAWLDTASLGPSRFKAKRQRLGRPRIVMPNVVSSLIRANAAWDPDGLLALDTVTSVVVDADRLPPEGVLRALNSRVGTWLLRHGIFGRNRLTNHMDAAYLGRFPLPAKGRWELLAGDMDVAYDLSEAERRLVAADVPDVTDPPSRIRITTGRIA